MGDYPVIIAALDSSSSRSAIAAELRSSEQVLWIGRPDPKRWTRPTWAVFTVGVPWTLLSFGAILLVSRHSLVGPLLLIPFAVAGYTMLSAPFRAYTEAKSVIYVVTDSRVLIIEGQRTKTVASYEHVHLNDIKRIERSDESGDLIFGQQHYRDSEGDERAKDIQFVGIPDVRGVEYLLRHVFREKDSAGQISEIERDGEQ